MNRSTTIDLCRALLFALMINTHSLTVAGVPEQHWLRAAFWLPNGWATVAFVVLSGFAAGYIYSTRPSSPATDRTIYRRATEIIVVMFGSNAVFAALRAILDGAGSTIATPSWWIGFFTLDTPWTISGVLMPTALVLFIYPTLAAMIKRNRWAMLGMLAIARLLADTLAANLGTANDNWAVRFFLTEGLGSFPVLPFVLNGCIGIWLGMLRHHSGRTWLYAMGSLLALQLVLYFGDTYFQGAMRDSGLASLSAFDAPAKFAWMFLIAYAVSLVAGRTLTGMLVLIGRYGLGSFVMHRVFLQALGLVVASTLFSGVSLEGKYAVLWIGTLFLTWGMCAVRQNAAWVDLPLRRFAL